MSVRRSDFDLDALITELRAAGLRVGVTELLRIHQVCERGPIAALGLGRADERDPGARLRGVVRAIVCKSEAERETFARVFDDWLEHARALAEAPAPTGASSPARRLQREVVSEPARPSVPRPLSARLRWRVFAVALAGCAAVLAWWLWPSTGPMPEIPDAGVAAVPPDAGVEDSGLEATGPPEHFYASIPAITIVPYTPPFTGWLPLLVSLLGFAGTAVTWSILRNRDRPVREPLPVTVAGPRRRFLDPPASACPGLLAPDEQEAVVWGIGRYLSDHRTRHIDLRTTVRATARAGGILQVHHERARYHREVWLWHDESVRDANLARLSDELAALLAANGLAAERAGFHGLPSYLTDPAGRVFSPKDLDDRRNAALVAVFTDGRKLSRLCDAPARRRDVDALMRQLAHWPHLAFVDFSPPGPSRLRALCARHDISVITPGALAGFLGGAPSRSPRPRDGAHVAIWAAACALAPAPIDEAHALALRAALHLPVSPLAVAALRTEAPGPPGRLSWDLAARARRLSWLQAAEVSERGPGQLTGVLGRALRFWREAWQHQLDAAEDAPWRDTPAHRRIEMEHALLALWDQPEPAIKTLYQLHQGPLQSDIEAHLGTLCPADLDRPDGERDHDPPSVRLPWTWRERSGREQRCLDEMKLGGIRPPARPRTNRWLWLGLGVGVGLIGLAAAVLSLADPSAPPLEQHGVRPAFAEARLEPRDGEPGGFAAWAKTGLFGAYAPLGRDQKAVLTWRRERRDCVVRIGGEGSGGSSQGGEGSGDNSGSGPGGGGASGLGSDGTSGAELVRCGSRVPAEDRAPDPLWVIDVAADDSSRGRAARELARGLIDCERAGVVYIGTRWDEHQRAAQSLPADLAEPVTPARRVTDVAAAHAALAADCPELDPCVGREWTDKASGLTFACIPAGLFTMGSAKNDKRADYDEHPAHDVYVSEFWMAKHEVTNAQYRAYRDAVRAAGGALPDEPHYWDDEQYNQDRQPVVGVDWHQANAFCEHYEHCLPTEAQWERGCRAGKDTPWSVPESDLGDYAWFGEDWDKSEPHPVGGKKSNVWGLHDMHGNVYEWVADWYASYPDPAPAEPRIDPTGPSEADAPIIDGVVVRSEGNELKLESGKTKVLRGGAFDGSSGFVRCALRGRDVPLYGDWDAGFRCVRCPRRQP